MEPTTVLAQDADSEESRLLRVRYTAPFDVVVFSSRDIEDEQIFRNSSIFLVEVSEPSLLLLCVIEDNKEEVRLLRLKMSMGADQACIMLDDSAVSIRSGQDRIFLVFSYPDSVPDFVHTVRSWTPSGGTSGATPSDSEHGDDEHMVTPEGQGPTVGGIDTLILADFLRQQCEQVWDEMVQCDDAGRMYVGGLVESVAPSS